MLPDYLPGLCLICNVSCYQQECSVNSPDYGPLPPNSPGWCLAPFDPEGVLRLDCHDLQTHVGITKI